MGSSLMRHGRVASFPDLDVASGGERDRLWGTGWRLHDADRVRGCCMM